MCVCCANMNFLKFFKHLWMDGGKQRRKFIIEFPPSLRNMPIAPGMFCRCLPIFFLKGICMTKFSLHKFIDDDDSNEKDGATLFFPFSYDFPAAIRSILFNANNVIHFLMALQSFTHVNSISSEYAWFSEANLSSLSLMAGELLASMNTWTYSMSSEKHVPYMFMLTWV